MTALAASTSEIISTIRSAPAVFATVSTYASQVARIAPQAVPVINQIIPILPLGPSLATIVKPFSKDAASFLDKAPSYADTMRQAAAVMAKAPQIANEAIAMAGPVATMVKRLGEDPALPAFIDRAFTLKDLLNKPSSGASRGGVTTPTKPGVGLDKTIPWLDRAIALAKRPKLLVAMPAAVLGLATLTGYAIGRARR